MFSVLFSILFFPFGSNPLFAQITIGSTQKTISGALLDLKEHAAKADNTTATKGLLMPRVKLTEPDKLIPVYTYLPNNEPSSTEEKKHTGLLVYNTNKCFASGHGLYLWNGGSWDRTGTSAPENLILDEHYFDIPSGKDLRPLTTQTLRINAPDGTSGTLTRSSRVGTLDFVNFASHPLQVGVSIPYPCKIDILPDPFTDAEVLSSPWKSKVSVYTLKSDCDDTETFTINQTNYALHTKDAKHKTAFSAEGYTMPLFLDGIAKKIETRGNVKWQATAKNDLHGIIEGFMLNDSNPVALSIEGGTTLKNSTSKDQDLYYKTSANKNLPKYTNVQIELADTESPKRFSDILINGYTCEGKIDYAHPKVLQREPQAGDPISAVYVGYERPNEVDKLSFLYSKFGDVYWMTTNARAVTYDSDIVSPPTITLKIAGSYSAAQYVYPHESNNMDRTTFDLSPEFGIFYNWYMATAGKNPSTGSQTDPNQPKYQGICLNGWHLPTYNEWIALDEEMKKNGSQYSGEKDNNNAPCKVAKTTCPARQTAADEAVVGSSLSPYDGGFSAPLSGYVRANGEIAWFGRDVWYWSSSSQPASQYGQLAYAPWAARGSLEWQYANPSNRRDHYASVRCVRN